MSEGAEAWVTLATNDSYAMGALVVARSLRRVNTSRKIAVMITPGVSTAMRDVLSDVFDLVTEVNILDSEDAAHLALLERPELGVTFTKIHCWKLTQFSKCVFLDADTLIIQNSDELFEREELSAAPDAGWPDCFNSGVFVFRPSLETYDRIHNFALSHGSFDGGDQGLLNMYFSGWSQADASRRLPFIYNMVASASYSYLPAYKVFGQNVKIVHFIGQAKPWLVHFDTSTGVVRPPGGQEHLQELLQGWWNIFRSEVHPRLSSEMGGGQNQSATMVEQVQASFSQIFVSAEPSASQFSFQPPPVYYPPPPVYHQPPPQPSHEDHQHHSHDSFQPTNHENQTSQPLPPPPVEHSQPPPQPTLLVAIQRFPPDHFWREPPPPPPPIPEYIPPSPPRVPSPERHSSPPHNHHHHQSPPRHHHHSPPRHHHQSPPRHHHRSPSPHHGSHQDQSTNTQSSTDGGSGSPPQDSRNSSHSNHDDAQRHNNGPREQFRNSSREPLTEEKRGRKKRSKLKGIAAVYAKMSLAGDKSTEQIEYEDAMRKNAWEQGHIDYMGKDSFDNIMKRIQISMAQTSVQKPQRKQTPPKQEPAPVEEQTLQPTPTQESSSKVEVAQTVEQIPKPEAPPKVETTPTPVASPKVEPTPTPEAPPKVESTPTPEAPPKVEPTPVPESLPKVESTSASAAPSKVEPAPEPKAPAKVESTPASAAPPKAEPIPEPVAPPKVESTPAPEAPPKVEATPAPEAPKVEPTPKEQPAPTKETVVPTPPPKKEAPNKPVEPVVKAQKVTETTQIPVEEPIIVATSVQSQAAPPSPQDQATQEEDRKAQEERQAVEKKLAEQKKVAEQKLRAEQKAAAQKKLDAQSTAAATAAPKADEPKAPPRKESQNGSAPGLGNASTYGVGLGILGAAVVLVFAIYAAYSPTSFVL